MHAPRLSIVPALLLSLVPAHAAVAAEAATVPTELVYGLTLAGVPLADADVHFDDRGGRYGFDVAWRTVGLAGIFASANGTLSTSGRLVGGRPHPRSYRLIERKGDTPFDVDMTLSGGTVSRLALEPPAKTGGDIVPIEPQHRRGVVDPLSAGLLPGSTAPDAVCDRTLPIFDGWSRWDVRLSPKSTTDDAPAGMRGPTVTCAARWVPVAGHHTKHRSVRFMAENRDIEVRFARLPGHDLWLPIEASVGTMIGPVRTRLTSVGGKK